MRILFLLLFSFCSLIAFAQHDVVRSVFTDETGITIETRVLVEKAGEQAKITFQQETENGFVFKNVNWSGEVLLYLTNGVVIRLEDTDIKGQSMQSGAYIAGYYVPNRYERYASYYLSPAECNQLRESAINRVEYRLDDEFDKEVRFLKFQDQNQFLKAQLTAIGM